VGRATKRHVLEPSAFDRADQDRYDYWIYEFIVDVREYDVRRYTGEPDFATILSNVEGPGTAAATIASCP